MNAFDDLVVTFDNYETRHSTFLKTLKRGSSDSELRMPPLSSESDLLFGFDF